MRWIIELLFSALIIILISYFFMYKYFFDWFCYLRSDNYLKCTDALICKADRNLEFSPSLLCLKREVFLFEKDSFFYNTQTYKNIYNNYIKSLNN